MEDRIITVTSGYDKRATVTLRLLTLADIQAVTWLNSLAFIDRFGCARDCRQNGAAKTWKTRPQDVEVPVKYGLRECWRAKMVNGEWLSGMELYVKVSTL